VPLQRPVSECSFRDLAIAAGHTTTDSYPGITFEIDEFRWLGKGCCHCLELRPILRFGTAGRTDTGPCRCCGQPVLPQPFYSYRAVPAPLVSALFDKRLKHLRATKARWAIVRHGEAATFLHYQTANGGNS
jgi:hypothetical protein